MAERYAPTAADIRRFTPEHKAKAKEVLRMRDSWYGILSRRETAANQASTRQIVRQTCPEGHKWLHNENHCVKPSCVYAQADIQELQYEDVRPLEQNKSLGRHSSAYMPKFIRPRIRQ